MTPAQAKLRLWRHDLIAFARQCLGFEPEDWQAKVLLAYQEGHRNLALKACKGPGKTAIESVIVWNFLATRPHAKGIGVSITGDNLRDNLWTELAKWQNRSDFLKAAFQWSALRIVAKDHPETWWFSARAFPKDADPQKQADTLAGLHGEHTIAVLDEASEMPDGVVVAAEATQSVKGQENIVMVVGNPTRMDGPLWRICTRDRAKWWVYEITGDPLRPDRAQRIRLEWAQAQIDKWGRDSSFVRTNVLGEFPLTASDKLLGPDACQTSQRRDPKDYTAFPKVLGVDVARFGEDRTVLFPRQGRVAFTPTVYRELDAVETAGRVAAYAAKWKPKAIFIDEGGVGGPVLDILRSLNVPGLHGIDFGGKALGEDRYLNRRAEMWWKLAEWVKGGGAIPDSAELVADLTAPSYKFTTDGRLQLESKDAIKKRGLPSPDLGDGLALTFAVDLPVADEHAEFLDVDQTADFTNIDSYDPFARREA